MDNQDCIKKVVKKNTGAGREFVKLFRRLKPFDRRKYPRFEVDQYIQCVCVYTKSGQRVECVSSISDISKAGLLIVTNEEKIYPGTEVEIRFQLPPRQETISITGKIVRTYRWHRGDWYYSGVQFQNTEEPGVQLLLDFVLGKRKR